MDGLIDICDKAGFCCLLDAAWVPAKYGTLQPVWYHKDPCAPADLFAVHVHSKTNNKHTNSGIGVMEFKMNLFGS